jgi:hypothetical protein
VEIDLEYKHHDLLDMDYGIAYEWFRSNYSLSVAEEFDMYYRNTLREIKTYPYHSHSLSMFKFFDELLNDDNFRYLRLGSRTSYYLFNYISDKNYILACMSLYLKDLADKLQAREQTKEVV